MGEESNQIKWIGIRPVSEQCVFQVEPGPWAATRSGVTRTQIEIHADLSAGSGNFYQVTNGKTFYVTAGSIHIRPGATAYICISHHASSGTLGYRFANCWSDANTAGNLQFIYPMPIVIPSQNYVNYLVGVSAGYANFYGWEE